MAFFRAFVVNSVSVTLRMVLPLEIWATWLGRGVDSIEDPRRGVAGARELDALVPPKRGQHRGSGTPMRPFAVNVVFYQQIYDRCSKPKDLRKNCKFAYKIYWFRFIIFCRKFLRISWRVSDRGKMAPARGVPHLPGFFG